MESLTTSFMIQFKGGNYALWCMFVPFECLGHDYKFPGGMLMYEINRTVPCALVVEYGETLLLI